MQWFPDSSHLEGGAQDFLEAVNSELPEGDKVSCTKPI